MGNISSNFPMMASLDVHVIFIILEYLPFADELTVLLSGNNVITKQLTDDASYRWRLRKLHYQHGIYSPYDSKLTLANKQLFLSFYARKKLWVSEGPPLDPDASLDEDNLPLWRQMKAPKTSQNFKIEVATRFRPKDENDDKKIPPKKVVTLPLHQRLKLIRLSKKLKTNGQALNVLKNEGDWFGQKWDNIEAENNVVMEDDKENQMSLAARRKAKAPPPLVSGLHSIDNMNGKVSELVTKSVWYSR